MGPHRGPYSAQVTGEGELVRGWDGTERIHRLDYDVQCSRVPNPNRAPGSRMLHHTVAHMPFPLSRRERGTGGEDPRGRQGVSTNAAPAVITGPAGTSAFLTGSIPEVQAFEGVGA